MASGGGGSFGAHPPRGTKKAHPGRAGVEWQECRSIVLRRDKLCAICKGALRSGVPPYSPWKTEVDHHPVTLAMMKARGMSESEVRRLSTDPNNCRGVHRSCHMGAGPPGLVTVQPGAVKKEGSASREW